MLYARVFTTILDSSLAEDWQTRHVFEDLLKLADDGVVDMTRQAIARRTNVPLEIVNAAIKVLEGRDPASRDPAEDGRRIVRLDEHRDWGWSIVNWNKYEAIRNTADQRMRTRERVRRHRERQRSDASPSALPQETEAATEPATEAEATLQERYRPLQTITRPKRGSAVASPMAEGLSLEDWLESLKTDVAYQGIDVQREYNKMVRWCETNRKEPTRRRFINWLNRCDRPLTAQASKPDHTKGF